MNRKEQFKFKLVPAIYNILNIARDQVAEIDWEEVEPQFKLR
jgi:hypothetical protein